MFLLGLCLFLGALVGTHSKNLDPLPDDKIVGGELATERQFPYQVSIQYETFDVLSHSCGGTIYDSKTIITAAHCCEYDFYSESVMAGELVLFGHNGHSQYIDVEKRIIHPDYVTINDVPHNDICLLILKKELALDNSYVSSLPINFGGNCSVGSQCSISGWGTLYSGSIYVSDELRFAKVPILDDSDCHNYGSSYNSTSMMCAGVIEGGIDTCQGDSGGPLICNNVLCGVVSFGYGCAVINYPGVYTRVETFADWIEEHSVASRMQTNAIHAIVILAFTIISKHLVY